MIQTMRKLKSGYINGTRVMLGNLGDFLNTSAITDLSFLGSQEDGYPDSAYKFVIIIINVFFNSFHFHKELLLSLCSKMLLVELNPAVQSYLDEHLLRAFSQRLPVNVKQSSLKPRQLRRRMSCKGAIKKTRSINVDGERTDPEYTDYFNTDCVTFYIDNLGIDSTLVERRPSSAVPPPWLEAKQQPYSNVFVRPNEFHPAPTASGTSTPSSADTNKIEEGYNLKVPPRIQINDRHDSRCRL